MLFYFKLFEIINKNKSVLLYCFVIVNKIIHKCAYTYYYLLVTEFGFILNYIIYITWKYYICMYAKYLL